MPFLRSQQPRPARSSTHHNAMSAGADSSGHFRNRAFAFLAATCAYMALDAGQGGKLILRQKTAALMLPKLGVDALTREQRMVIAFFHDLALIQHDKSIHRGNG